MHVRMVLLILLIVFAAPGMADSTCDETCPVGLFLSETEKGEILNQFETGAFLECNITGDDPLLEDLYRDLALGLAARGEYAEAIDVLLLTPGQTLSRESSILLAFLYSRTGEYDGALGHINRLRVTYPDDRTLDNAMAYLVCLAGSPEEAADIQETVITHMPGYAPALDTWGVILTKKEQYEEAEKALEKAGTELPDDTEVLTHLAELYHLTERNADAQDLYQKAVKTDQVYGPGQKGYARVLIDLKRYAEAAHVIRAALALMPGDEDLIEWEQDVDSILLAWHIRQEKEKDKPLLITRVVQENHS